MFNNKFEECRISGYFDVEFVKNKDYKKDCDILAKQVSEVTIDYFKREIKICFVRLVEHDIATILKTLNYNTKFDLGYYEYSPSKEFSLDNMQRAIAFMHCEVISYVETENIAYNLPGSGIATIKFNTWYHINDKLSNLPKPGDDILM